MNLKNKGLSVPQIANLVGVEARTIWRWLSDDVNPQNHETKNKLIDLVEKL